MFSVTRVAKQLQRTLPLNVPVD